MTEVFLDIAPVAGANAWRAACEVGRAVGPLLGLPDAAVTALDHVYERWDGRGIPGIARETGLPLAARVVHVAEQAVLSHAQGGLAGAVAETRRRAGGHLDPDLADAFGRTAEAALAPLTEPDILAAVVAAEPGTASLAGPDGMRRMCRALWPTSTTRSAAGPGPAPPSTPSRPACSRPSSSPWSARSRCTISRSST
jgi:hypothetical protein